MNWHGKRKLQKEPERLHRAWSASHLNNLLEKKPQTNKQYLLYVAWQHLYAVPPGSCFCLPMRVLKAPRETSLWSALPSVTPFLNPYNIEATRYFCSADRKWKWKEFYNWSLLTLFTEAVWITEYHAGCPKVSFLFYRKKTSNKQQNTLVSFTVPF